MNKLLTAAVVALSFAGTAVADPILIDLNSVTDTNGNLTSFTPMAVDSLNVDYSSHTFVNTTTGSVNTYGGMDLIANDFGGLLSGAIYSDFNDMTTEPAVGFGTPSYTNIFSAVPDATGIEYSDSGSFLTFGLNLVGTLTPNGITYTGGEMSIWMGDYTGGDSAAYSTLNPVKVLSTEFVNGSITAGDQSVSAKMETSNTQVLVDDVFFFNNGYPNFESFEDYLDNTLNDLIRVEINQNVTGGAFNLADDIANPIEGGVAAADSSLVANGDAWSYISAAHNAEVTFNVPEPTTIAILGLGLLGLAGASRRKS